ncbi:hypothetical protein D5086_022283 [Populus alba]|uniref:Uncharacterized protein n=3 Tax=Populus TaxID=3689 RepID=A0A4U5PQI6_POPAL|nr:hypothetical protein NC653_027299 [Populus alba x Populus x berolinensis]TKR99153.1 hypothetical protein D5086_0000195420 [Populus alba]
MGLMLSDAGVNQVAQPPVRKVDETFGYLEEDPICNLKPDISIEPNPGLRFNVASATQHLGVFLLVNSPSLAIIRAKDGDNFRRWGAVSGSLVRFDIDSISLL